MERGGKAGWDGVRLGVEQQVSYVSVSASPSFSESSDFLKWKVKK